MNNNTLRLIIATVAALVAVAANACWYSTYSPVEYLTCRIPKIDNVGDKSMVELWRGTLLPDVSTDEIKKLIYTDGYTVEQIRGLEVSPTLRRRLVADDNVLLEYVCVMRQVNGQRDGMSNPWYYYYAGEPRSVKLNELADTCLSRLDSRYGDRYALLAARALNTLQRYADLDTLAASHVFKDAEMERLFRREYAGVLYNMGQYDTAAEIYARAGDKRSLKMCLKKQGEYQNALSVLSRLADYESNYNQVANGLASYIRSLELSRYAGLYDSYGFEYEYEYETCSDTRIDIGSLIETAHAHAATPGVYQPLWLYVEAMGRLIDSNDFARADSALALINTAKVDPDFARSIRTLRFITQSRMRPYDDSYLPWVAAEAQWLISQSDLQRAEGPVVRHSGYDEDLECYMDYDDEYENPYDAEEIMFCRDNHHSNLYFSDMLHKAADVVIAPRMLQHGDTLAALQLLDIVDHANLTAGEVRDIDSHGNASACFAMECGADVVLQALARSANPRTPLDRLWTRVGSIRNTDRWHDLAGTALLAEGRYKEAVKYLSQVSPRYAYARNLCDSGWVLNPFAVELRTNAECRKDYVRMREPQYYKLWFAQQMSRLEDTFGNPALSDEKRAEAKLKYGVGMANSVYPCWELTRYGEGYSVFSPWENKSANAVDLDDRQLAHNLFSEYYAYDYVLWPDNFVSHHRRLGHLRLGGERHIADALGQIKDRETMAAYLRSMAQYKTIKHHYADTSVGQEMRSKCDRWDMY